MLPDALKHMPTHLKSSRHGLAKPYVLLCGSLAGVPILLRHSGHSWVDAGLACFHVAKGLDGVVWDSLVRVDPVKTWTREELK